MDNVLIFTGTAAGFAMTLALLLVLKGKLPTDIGRAYAVNAAAAKGKPRGAGIVFIPVFIAVSAICGRGGTDYYICCALMLCAMLSGFLDDASATPWGDIKKGLIDLVISLGCALTYVIFNGSSLTFAYAGCTVVLPAWLYVLLGTVLVWASINVTNCTDGVDGLSSSMAIVSLAGFTVVQLVTGQTGLGGEACIMIGCLAAYLMLNCSPSILLMGDAGSRAIGVFFALAAMYSGRPLVYIPICLVFILDGGLGLIKVALLRYLKIRILTGTRTPLHDHFRKNLGWSDTQVVTRYTVLQAVIALAAAYLAS